MTIRAEHNVYSGINTIPHPHPQKHHPVFLAKPPPPPPHLPLNLKIVQVPPLF